MIKHTLSLNNKPRKGSNKINQANFYTEDINLLGLEFLKIVINSDLKKQRPSGTIAHTQKEEEDEQ